MYTIDTNLSMNNIFKIRSENAIIEENVDNYKIERKTRKNVMNHLLNVSIVITNNKSLSHLTDYREKHIDSITKANYQLVNFVLDYLNASRNFKIVDTWGYRVNNSSYYTGMLGQIQRNEAEIGGKLMVFLQKVSLETFRKRNILKISNKIPNFRVVIIFYCGQNIVYRLHSNVNSNYGIIFVSTTTVVVRRQPILLTIFHKCMVLHYSLSITYNN